MTSTSPLTIPADPVVPSAPSLSLVALPRFAAPPLGASDVAPLGASADAAAPPAGRSAAPALRAVQSAADPADPSTPAPRRARFRRLVVFTGQLS